MARGTIASATLTSVGSAEIYVDGHSLNSIDLIITGTATATVEYSNSSSAGSSALWSVYSSMSDITASQSGNSFYAYEKVRVRVTSWTSGSVKIYFSGYSSGV